MEWNGWVNWRKTRGDKESGEMSEKEKRDGMNRSDADAADRYSLRGRVFHRLREDILNGKYKELEELKEAAIAEEMGVSRTPVREAFRQLELEGLIQIIPNKGAYVTGITVKDVQDIYAVSYTHLDVYKRQVHGQREYDGGRCESDLVYQYDRLDDGQRKQYFHPCEVLSGIRYHGE